MKRFIVSAFILTLLSTHTLTAAEDSSLRKEIEAIVKQFDAAYARHDPEALSMLYSHDAEKFPPDKGLIKGREAIRKHFTDSFKETGDSITKSTTREIFGQGDSATEVGTFRDQLPDGTVVEDGAYMVVWRKQEGEWKMRREIWNTSSRSTRLNDSLKPLQPFLGKWTGESKTSEGEVRCIFTWKPAIDGNAVLSEGTIWMNGKVSDQWVGILRYDSQTKSVTSCGASVTGQDFGTVHVVGKKLVFQAAGRNGGDESNRVDELIMDGDVLRYSELSAYINGKPPEQLMKNMEFRRQK